MINGYLFTLGHKGQLLAHGKEDEFVYDIDTRPDAGAVIYKDICLCADSRNNILTVATDADFKLLRGDTDCRDIIKEIISHVYKTPDGRLEFTHGKSLFRLKFAEHNGLCLYYANVLTTCRLVATQDSMWIIVDEDCEFSEAWTALTTVRDMLSTAQQINDTMYRKVSALHVVPNVDCEKCVRALTGARYDEVVEHLPTNWRLLGEEAV